MNYYNEIDFFAAKWLTGLMLHSIIPHGKIDVRSIHDVKPEDITEYKQLHFFAGIGGWCEALKLALWPPDRPVWTGSCPCQPFSIAGKKKANSDERHLWPQLLRLITEIKPPTIFGEQVASPDGRVWLAGVRVDLEALGYDFGAADLCAAGSGAPHMRQRLFWVANAKKQRLEKPVHEKLHRWRISEADRSGAFFHWEEAIWHPCTDGKIRRIPSESAFFPLAHGFPGRVGLLRGIGNAIVPQVAAFFIRAFLEAEEGQPAPILGTPTPFNEKAHGSKEDYDEKSSL